MSDDGLHIRSFRVVFDLERRVHRIDRWRLPLPYGLPLRSIGYAVVAVIAVALVSRLPGIGATVAALPAPVRFVLAPIAVAYALTGINVDGRSAHRTAAALLGYGARRRRLAATRAVPAAGCVVRLASVPIAPNAHGAHLRRGTVRGDALAVIHIPAQLRERRRTLDVRPLGDGWQDPPTEIAFDAPRRVRIR